jgi:hypothetical protein
MAYKVGCIIQGDIRRGSQLVLEHIPKLFDYTVFSTWNDGSEIPSGKFDVVKNAKPATPGFTNRNYQRFTSARGLEAAAAAGCDYVLKWRSDMLPTQFSTARLVEWANFSPPINTKSRIVVPAFRNISIAPDTFSTMPDLFAFGHIEEMTKLWGDSEFDYSKEFNMPLVDQKKLEPNLIHSPSLADFYCAEAELYAIYRSRLEQQTNNQLSHKLVAENYMHLIDHNQLGILWFDSKAGFRSIGQAWEHPWWTVKIWERRNAKVYPCGYQSTGLVGKFKRKLSRYKIASELKMQERIWSTNYPDATL